MRKKVLLLASLLVSLGCNTFYVDASEKKFSGSGSVSFLSQYIWRGQELSSDSLVIQPSVTLAYSNFSVNLWGNLDTDHYVSGGSNWTETDLTLDYTNSVGKFSYSVGYIYYALDGAQDSQEVYISLSYDTFLKPNIKVYREISNYPSWYITLSLSKSFEISKDLSLDIGAICSYLISEDAGAYPEVDKKCKEYGICKNEFSNLHDAVISISMPYKINDNITISPQLYWAFPLSSDASDEMKWRSVDGDDNFVYGGISFSLSF